jgi:multicomponent Na+:H+ antiporter subunit D
VAPVSSLMPWLAVLTSLGAAVAIVASARRPNLRETWTLVAAVAKIGIVAALLPAVLRGEQPQGTLLEIAPGIELTLRADPAGMVFALLASVLWLLTSIYSIGYVRGLGEQRQTRYYASFAVCLSATIGLAFAANLFTFFVFYELLTVATYPLVVHKQSPERSAQAAATSPTCSRAGCRSCSRSQSSSRRSGTCRSNRAGSSATPCRRHRSWRWRRCWPSASASARRR